jgi:L-threonylcarbamoyladenylate synthase
LRWPDHEIPARIATALGSPLATTSANISSLPSPRTAQEVLAQLQSGYELLIDGGEAPGGVDSTVIDFSGTEPRLLRRGGLERSVIESALGPEATASLLD